MVGGDHGQPESGLLKGFQTPSRIFFFFTSPHSSDRLGKVARNRRFPGLGHSEPRTLGKSLNPSRTRPVNAEVICGTSGSDRVKGRK